MHSEASLIADKTIVERLDVHADDPSRRVVRDLRSRPGNRAFHSHQGDQFARDALAHHVDMQDRCLPAFLVTLAFSAYLAHFSVQLSLLVAWCFAGLGLAIWSHRAIATFKSTAPDRIDHDAWTRKFQLSLLVIGCFWGAMFAVHPYQPGQLVVPVLLFVGAMVLTGASLVTVRFIRHGVLLTSLPFLIVVATQLALDKHYVSICLGIVLIASSFFLNRIGETMRNSFIDNLKSEAERDRLIMELEAARGISEEARRRAEEANLAKSRFLATMSHELRTPLNAILGFSEVMSNEVMGPLDNEHYREYVDDIHASGSHLLTVINEILDLSRVEAGRYELKEEAASLAHAAEQSQQMVKLSASEKGIKLVMQIQPSLPLIWADSKAIRQIILNLLSNAIKFTPTGGTIWLKCGWTVGGGQYISVRDTGPGIAEEEIPIVMSSFGQGSIAIKSAEQGTGLGLPIVQALMHMHDGHFELKSKLREGTEVIATFPRKRVLEVMPVVEAQAAPLPIHERGGFSVRNRPRF